MSFKRLALGVTLLGFCSIAAAQSPIQWTEGKHYFRLQAPQTTSTPGKIEVLDVFSYCCPTCNRFQPTVDLLKAALPAGARMAYLPAGFVPEEDWPVFQRAFLAAQELGIAEKSHDAMYEAIWGKGGPLSLVDWSVRRLLPQDKQPTLKDVARFYRAYGVSEEKFLTVANSFSIDSRVKQADDQVRTYQVDSTPTLIVNGKYRLTPASAGGFPQAMDLALYLVKQEESAK